MNKKQAGIILTLLALIVCAGVLAAKVNGKVDDPSGSIPSALSFNKDNETTTENKDYFYDSRSLKEQQDVKTIENLKAIAEDKNTSAAQKEEATKTLTNLTVARDYETRIELSIKSNGYDDVLCFIEGKKARIIVKSDQDLTDKQTIAIQDVVMNVAKIKDVIIERK